MTFGMLDEKRYRFVIGAVFSAGFASIALILSISTRASVVSNTVLRSDIKFENRVASVTLMLRSQGQTSLLSNGGTPWRFSRVRVPSRFVSLDSYPAGDTFPYWERENTGDPELFAQEYIDYCINKLYPDVGCPGALPLLAYETF